MSMDMYKNQTSILLVDDNPSNIQILRECLRDLGHKLLVARDGEAALKIVERAKPSLLLLDIIMPGLDGFAVCKQIKHNPETADTSIIFLTALDNVEDKVKGFRLGAVDFVTKPFQAEEVLARVETQLTLQALRASVEAKNRALARELQIAQRLSRDAAQQVEGALLGTSPSLQHLLTSIHHIAEHHTNVLLTGPPGAGYEAIARRIHQLSPRGENTFLQFNGLTLGDGAASALLPASVSESGESAATPSMGEEALFNLADGGTIFVEHIQAIPQEVQRRLYRYFEQLQQQRYASSHAMLPDVRLITYTEDDLQQKARTGEFYGPLIPYISQDKIEAPSLLERRQDIPTITYYLLEQHSQKLGKLFNSLNRQTLKNLQTYSWPGNIDELSNLLKRQVAIQRGPQLSIERSLFGTGPTMGGYRLQQKLGVGGMGEVWRAQHQLLAYPAAVKVIRQEPKTPVQQDVALRRFQAEARITAYLQSPHTVKLYDFGVTPRGEQYYVMELLQGMDLGAIIERFGPLHPARVIALLRPVCLSLAEAHEAGLIHRDLKPENIFICRLGRQYDFPKVLDFGIAKELTTESDKVTTMSQSGPVVGSPGYIAPEIMTSKDTPIDHRYDLYSLGCVAYKALTGQEVFPGKTDMQRLVMHATKKVTPASMLSPYPFPEGLDELLLDCLAKQPQERIDSADAIYQRLGQLEPLEPWTEEHASAWWREHAPEEVQTHLEAYERSTDPKEIDALFLSKSDKTEAL